MQLRLFDYETKEVITTINVRKGTSPKTINKKITETLEKEQGRPVRWFWQGVLYREMWRVLPEHNAILEEPGNEMYERWAAEGPGEHYWEFKKRAEERARKEIA